MRIESDKSITMYLNENDKELNNVFTIKEKEEVLTLEDLLHKKVDDEAKKFHKMYTEFSSNIQLMDNQFVTERAWKDLKLVDRESNRALAIHDDVKKDVYELLNKDKQLETFIDECFEKIKEEKKKDIDYKIKVTSEEFIELINKPQYAGVLEMLKIEHRRWCYFKASKGWCRTDEPKTKTNSGLKENPSMCKWDELVKHESQNCCYDLMPWVYRHKVSIQPKKDKVS